MNTPVVINLILSYIGAIVYLGGAVLVFRQSYHGGVYPRARRALALLLLMWSVFAIAPAFDDPQSGPFINLSLMSVTTLLIGGFSMIISLLYPLELAHPGWITPRNVVKLALPFTGITLFYVLVLAVLQQPIYDIHNIEELVSGLGEFNIWYRFVFYLAVCLYLAYLFLSTSVTALQLHRQSIGDTTPIDSRQTSWLRIYAIGQACIAVAYLLLLLHGDIWTQIAHRTIGLIFFSVVIYRVGFSSSQNPKITKQV